MAGPAGARRSCPWAASAPAPSGLTSLLRLVDIQGRLLLSTSSFLPPTSAAHGRGRPPPHRRWERPVCCMEHDGAIFPRPSHPVVHPAPAPMEVEAAQGQGPHPAPDAAEQGEGANGNAPPPGVLMVDPWGAPGTRCALVARLTQAILAAGTVAFMATASDFHTVSAFLHLVVVAALQCLWCFVLAMVDLYGLLVKRSFRTLRITTIFSIGDWVMGGLTFAAVLGSAAITVLIDIDMQMCLENHCLNFRGAVAMGLLSWFAMVPSCVFNLWTAVYRGQTTM